MVRSGYSYWSLSAFRSLIAVLCNEVCTYSQCVGVSETKSVFHLTSEGFHFNEYVGCKGLIMKSVLNHWPENHQPHTEFPAAVKLGSEMKKYRELAKKGGFKCEVRQE